MKTNTGKILILIGIILMIGGFLFQVFGQDYPKPVGYVNDFAKVMTVGEVKTLDAILADYEKRSSIEIAVVTIPSLEGQSIEEYTVELATQWGVGKKGKDNGLVILNSIKDRKWRIEVGYGLEGYVTDAYGATLGYEFLTPLLKQGKYYEAYKSVVEKIMKDFGNLTEEDKARLTEEKEDSGLPWWIWVIIVIMVLLIIAGAILDDDGSYGGSSGGFFSSGGGSSSGGSSFGGGGFGGGGSSGSY